MLLSPPCVIFYNLDPIFKSYNDGFNLTYCEKHWIDVKRLERLKFSFCPDHEGDQITGLYKASASLFVERGIVK